MEYPRIVIEKDKLKASGPAEIVLPEGSLLDLTNLIGSGSQELSGLHNKDSAGTKFIMRRNNGILAYKSFWLNRNFDWVMTRDNEDEIVLIPLIKTGR
uniref:Uncharacterized protein n=1 Tax=viral metagenome TaxID=1070528 RepID=A0A6M3J8W8_9ZZZZ